LNVNAPTICGFVAIRAADTMPAETSDMRHDRTFIPRSALHRPACRINRFRRKRSPHRCQRAFARGAATPLDSRKGQRWQPSPPLRLDRQSLCDRLRHASGPIVRSAMTGRQRRVVRWITARLLAVRRDPAIGWRTRWSDTENDILCSSAGRERWQKNGAMVYYCACLLA